MLELILGYIFLISRIITLGSERIFLKLLKDIDSFVVSSLFFLTAAVFLSPLFFFLPPSVWNLSLLQVGLILGISTFYAVGFYTYVKALSVADTSLIAPLYNSSLLWLLVLGSIFLSENVGIIRIVGGILMIIGVFYLYPGSFAEKIDAIKSSEGTKYMLLGSLFLAVGRTVDSYLINQLNTNVYLYAFLSNFLIGFYLLLIVLSRGKLSIGKEIIHHHPKIFFVGSLLTGWSYVFLLSAFRLLDVTIAEPLTLLSVFVTAALAKILLDEDVKERLAGMIIMVIGAVLLVIS